MAAVTICSDFGATKNSLTVFPLLPPLFPMKRWDQMPWSSFSECWALSQLVHSPLSLSSRGFLVLLHFLPWGWYYVHICSSSFLPAILIPACASSSPAFLMIYSAYKLNKQGDNIHPWHTPFPIWNQSVVPCPILTVASWPAYRFFKISHSSVACIITWHCPVLLHIFLLASLT